MTTARRSAGTARDEAEAPGVHPNPAFDVTGQAGHKVALVSSSFAPYVGGVETHVEKVARELTRMGHAVEVWTVDRGVAGSTIGAEGYRVRYLPTPLPARDVRSVAKFVAQAPRAWSQWRRARREFAPTVLHVHCFGPNGLYATALASQFRFARRPNLPLIVTSHGETRGDDDNAFEQSALLRAGLRFAVTRAMATTAPSEYVLADLRNRFGLRGGVVIPNGVDRSPQSGTVAARTRDQYVLGVGRLGYQKGFDLLIRAFSRARIGNNVKLRLVGDGPERASLGALVEELRMGRSVEFVGSLNPPAVAAEMSGALTVVIPSRVEAFGIVALEAWREGAPLIMTSRGGGPEFVRNLEDGIVVDPTDVGALAAVVERVVGDSALAQRLALAGRRRWTEFSWSRVAAGYVALYSGEAGTSTEVES